MPPHAADLCTKLPPPDCFNGPYVILDQLLRTLQSCTLSMPTTDIKEGKSPFFVQLLRITVFL